MGGWADPAPHHNGAHLPPSNTPAIPGGHVGHRSRGGIRPRHPPRCGRRGRLPRLPNLSVRPGISTQEPPLQPNFMTFKRTPPTTTLPPAHQIERTGWLARPLAVLPCVTSPSLPLQPEKRNRGCDPGGRRSRGRASTVGDPAHLRTPEGSRRAAGADHPRADDLQRHLQRSMCRPAPRDVSRLHEHDFGTSRGVVPGRLVCHKM